MATADAPTLAAARRAAGALTVAGARQVVLFGSVASGEATAHSDIDLIAVYDDIDYSNRGAMADRLTAAAASAAGHGVDVLLTDLPEWRMRTTRVRTSLEAHAALGGVVLAERRSGRVDWGKEMVMPTNDYQEGLYRLGRLHDAITKLANNLTPGMMEARHRALGDTEGEVLAETARLLTLGGAAHSVTEHSVKALIHVTRETAAAQWGHRIEELCGQLPDETRRLVEGLLRPPGAASITPWHEWERYHRRGKDPDPTPLVMAPLIRAACRAATYTAGYFGTETPARLVLDCVGVIEEHLDTYDLGR